MSQTRSSSRKTPIVIAMALVLAATALVYRPGLNGSFVFDDLHNIGDNKALAVDKLDLTSLEQAALSRSGGLSSRPLSMLSFALNHYFSGLDPFAYKATNLAIHALNGLALFFLTRLILIAYRARRDTRLTDTHVNMLSMVISAAWLLHPINLTSVLYVVQRMNSLAALFTVLGLITYMSGRLRLEDGRRGGSALILAGFVVFTPLAILCKENGALLPLYTFVLELALFRFQVKSGGGRAFLGGVFGVFLLLPLLGFVISLIADPGWIMHDYINRDFTLGERLLTEARVMWLYLFLIFVPDVRHMGLYHDDFAVSHGLLQPLATLPAILGLAGLAVAAALCYRRLPLVTLGLLWFFAGHSMESTIIPLEPVFEHRNYLPVYGILLPVFYYLSHPLRRWDPYTLRHTAAALIIGFLGYTTSVRADQWGDLTRFSETEVAHHPHSPRANYALGRVYFIAIEQGLGNRQSNFIKARRYFARATLDDDHFTNGLFGMITLYEKVHAKLPQGVIGMLAQRLEQAPFSNNSSNMLADLVSCQENKICHLPTLAMDRLLQSALDNKTLRGLNKASVLTSASRFFGLLNNYPMALKLAQEAAQATPGELQYRLNVVFWLITMGRLDEAQHTLDKLKHKDTLNRHADYIREQEQRLSDARLVQRLEKTP